MDEEVERNGILLEGLVPFVDLLPRGYLPGDHLIQRDNHLIQCDSWG